MRIGHYAPQIWAAGGIATYIRRTGTAQSLRGHDVHYLSQDPGDEAEPADTHVIDSPSELFGLAESLSLDVLHLHKSVAHLPDDRVPTVRTMHGHQASCPSGTRYLSRSGQPCDRVPSLPACLWGHVVDRCGSLRPRNVASNVSRLQHEIEFAARVPTLPVSDFLRSRMIEAGCPPEQLQTVHSPAPRVDRSTSMPRTGPPRFLFVGRLAPQKGIMWLLQAFARIPEDAHLDIAGDGDLAEAARSYVRRHKLTGRVTFHGWVSEEQVTRLMQFARAVVFPSVWHEPAGLVSLEAAAHGRALVASDVGGIPEYARDDFSILVSPNDIDALANALLSLYRDPARAASMGEAGRRLAQSQYSMDDFIDRLDEVYHAVIQSRETSIPLDLS